MSCPDDAILYDFISGQLRGPELVSLDSHMDDCPECCEVVAAFALGSRPGLSEAAVGAMATADAEIAPTQERVSPDSRTVATAPTRPRAPGQHRPSSYQLARGDSVSRYLILDTLGQGAMGVVYAAYDPDLDRRVALKLLHPRAGAQAQDRMIREARAMAKLAHVNVVTIFEVGPLGDSVYLAMELIDGTTLRHWLQERERPWREIRAMFVQVAEGLSAAHQAGIVHRDVKPDNVIVGRDGRARVTDFGLARAERDASEASESMVDRELHERAQERANVGGADDKLTHTGSLMGTPAYMAPEQFARAVADARTDQFGLCVALFEALYGTRPFAGRTLDELQESVQATRIVETPRGAGVPRWLHAVLLRGLQRAPEERFPSVAALRVALQRDPGRRWRRWAVFAALALSLALSLVLLGKDRSAAQDQRCTGAEAEAAAVWNQSRQQQIIASFAGSDAPYAAASASGAISVMNEWRSQWVAMHEQTCRATRVQGQQSERLLDIRMHCLRRQLTVFDALAGELEHADAQVVDNAAGALSALEDVSECAQIEVLSALPPEPRDPEAQAQLRQLEERIAAIKALIATGKYERASELTPVALADARALGYGPVVAEAALVHAHALRSLAQLEAAEEAAYNALFTATKAGDRRTTSRSAIALAGVFGARGEFARAHRSARHAVAMIEHMGAPADLDARAHNAVGAALYNLERHVDAERALRHALQRRIEYHGPEHPAVARTLTNLGNALRARAEYQSARDTHERALAMDRAVLGPAHPNIGRHLHNIAGVLRLQKQPRAARQRYREALAVKQAALSPNHPDIALTYNSLGLLLHDAGDLAGAIAHYQRALDIFQAVGAAETALSAYNLGRALLEDDQPFAAHEPLVLALEQYLETVGPDDRRTEEVRQAVTQAEDAMKPRARRRAPRSPIRIPSSGYGAGQAWDGS